MHLASYRRPDGTASFGLLEGTRLLDLRTQWKDRHADLASLLADPAGLAAARALLGQPGPLALGEVTLLPPIPRPGKILCVGLNYLDHRVETGRPPTEQPVLFVRFPDSLVGHGAALRHPGVSQEYDYEGELAVIIGRPAHRVTEARALDFVAGYACFNDGSVRDWQRHTNQFTPGKNFLESGAFGPTLVTADEVGDPTQLSITTRLGGQVLQHDRTASMLFPIPRLIAYISTFTRLEPGDVIATGTPGGVGFKRTPPVFMKPGDLVEVDIPGVGLLANRVAAAT
jgi:2-keto-4-pentenoate hydratase/2-oxohepta-3-ene-1,7-dioic acid hydratase in catechol pathway